MSQAKYVKEFADSHPSSTAIYKGKLRIDQLDFAGFWGAFAVFDVCVGKKRRAKAEQERLDAINKLPKDPFAE